MRARTPERGRVFDRRASLLRVACFVHFVSQVLGAGVCPSCSIYILDLSVFAHDHGYPVCNLTQAVTVNPDNGVVYLEDTAIPRKVDQKFGTHSAPWYLYKVRFVAQTRPQAGLIARGGANDT